MVRPSEQGPVRLSYLLIAYNLKTQTCGRPASAILREIRRRIKHACLMLRVRLSLDRGCVVIATQGVALNTFTVESLNPVGTGAECA